MDYKKHYEKLMEKAKFQTAEKFKTNYHHIQPKCVGGSDNRSNRIHLTHRQHFIAHLLLHKMFPDNVGLAKSVTIAGRKGGVKIRSRVYEQLMTVVRSDERLKERGRNTIEAARRAFWNNPEAVARHKKIVAEHGKRIGPTIGLANLKGYWDNKTEELRANGRKGASTLNAMRYKCLECGKESTPGGLAAHQKFTNHTGVVKL